MGTVVETQLEDGVLTITLNDPDRLNAMSWPLLDGLDEALGRTGEDDVRVVLLAGNGRAFCAGADMRELAVDTHQAAQRYVGKITEVIGKVRACGKPVVAAVQGWAVGGGAELALEADLFTLAHDVKFRQPDIAIGSTPATAWRLVQLVGIATASRVVLGGEDLDGEMAVHHGMARELDEVHQVRARAMEIATRLADISPLSTPYAKRALQLASATDGATDLELNLAAELACYQSPEQRDAVARFLER